jgi:hypothetical protein
MVGFHLNHCRTIWEAYFERSFVGQVPIAGLCCLLTANGLAGYFPSLTEEDQNERGENKQKSQALAFDFPGAISLAIGVTSLLTVIDVQNRLSWIHPLVLGLSIIGVVSIIAFLILETYPGSRELLIPMRLLKTEIGIFCAGQVSFLL